MTIDPGQFNVTIDGKKIALPKKEFQLLYFLASQPGQIFERDDILGQIWGRDVVVDKRTINVHIRKIRKKLGTDCITTVKK